MSEELHQTIDAARRGDGPAFDSLFARHLPGLVAFLRCRVDGELAQHESIRDIAQSVCREVLMDLDDFEFRGEEAFRGWLFLQATRKIVDRYRYHRSARRDVGRVDGDADLDDADVQQGYLTLCTPSRHAAGREEVSRIERALRLLPEDQRDAVLLSRIAGVSYAEIAQQSGCSQSAVRGLVARGLARLAQILKDGLPARPGS